MTVRVNKQSFNIREKLSELERPIGVKGNEIMGAETAQDARDLVSAGRKNKIINGAMLIDQRNGGAANTNSNGYHLDRFRTQVSGMDELVQTYQQVNDGPTGFTKSLKITTITPETDIAGSSEYLSVYQKMEGINLQDLAYGTNNAKPVTVSFYVKSSITGTFAYTVYRNETQDRSINKTYTINNANTWERKTITLEGDTVQAIGNDANDNWWNVWHLAASSSYMTSPNPYWGNYSGTNWAGYHEQNGVITTNGATWQITGVQLEVGRNATEFEHRLYAEELALCKRYYQRMGDTNTNEITLGGYAVSGSAIYHSIQLPVEMRAVPTLTQVGSFYSVRTGQPVSLSGHRGRKGFGVSHTTNADGTYLLASNANAYFVLDADM